MKNILRSYPTTCLATLIIVLSFQPTKAQVSVYAGLPYTTGFESGSLDANWHIASSTAQGRIQVWNSSSLIWGGDTAQAHSGTYWLGLDVMPPGPLYTVNEAWMGLDLAGATSVNLEFWFSDWDDEPEPEDGIFISDNGGLTFTKVLTLDGDNYTDLQWYSFQLNLDSVNTAHGLTFTATYVVKFQQHDDYYFAGGNDGFLFDDISVLSCMPSSSSISPVACFSYTAPSGNATYTASGLYTDTIPNSTGCDSIISINLTVNTIDLSVTQNLAMLTANETGATYQWLDCNNAYTAISGQTAQSFTATVTGSYAVEITKNGCVDTSACYNVMVVGIQEFDAGSVSVYPNPATDAIRVTVPGVRHAEILLFDITGRQVMRKPMAGEMQRLDLNDLPRGVYTLQVRSGTRTESMRFIRQ